MSEIDSIIARLEEVERNKNQLLEQIGKVVVDSAKSKTHSRAIKDDLKYELEDDIVRIGTNVFYSAYEEFGTGKYAVHGDGTKGFWVYVQTEVINPIGPIPGLTGAKHYDTYDEALDTKKYLESLGIPANKIHITEGQHANPFLEQALHENVDNIKQIITDYVKEKL